MMPMPFSATSTDEPVTVFHHIPKCGGTSLMAVLGRWFEVRRDYRQGWVQEFGPPLDLGALDGRHCLCGHFDAPGAGLDGRYPQVRASARYRVFTFVREPLALVLSLYRYEGLLGLRRDDVLERYLMEHAGFLAAALGATADTWRPVLDRYFFIGVLERFDESVNRLAHRLGKPRVALPRLNTTDPYGRAPHIRRLSPQAIDGFRQASRIDYAIYQACVQRFHDALTGACGVIDSLLPQREVN